MARKGEDVRHDEGLPARRGGAADSLSERDPHARGLALERAEHELLAAQQVEAAPVDPVERRREQAGRVREIGERVGLTLEQRRSDATRSRYVSGFARRLFAVTLNTTSDSIRIGCGAMSALSGRRLAMYVFLCAVWGSTWIVIKVGLRDLPPLWFAGVRMALACTLLPPVALARGAWLERVQTAPHRLERPPADRRRLRVHLPRRGAHQTGLAAVLFATFPIFAALFAHELLADEPFTAGRVSPRSVLAGVAVVEAPALSASFSAALGGAARGPGLHPGLFVVGRPSPSRRQKYLWRCPSGTSGCRRSPARRSCSCSPSRSSRPRADALDAVASDRSSTSPSSGPRCRSRGSSGCSPGSGPDRDDPDRRHGDRGGARQPDPRRALSPRVLLGAR